jgi:transcriptional regulator with XRE-family HTH domain
MTGHRRATLALAPDRQEDQGDQPWHLSESHRFSPRRLQVLLRGLRGEAGLTQEEVSNLTGISKSIISRIENGVIENPRFDVVAKLCFVYNVSLDDLASRVGLPHLSRPHAPSEIADPRLRSALERLLSSNSIGWRNHVIATLWMLVQSAPDYLQPAPADDPWLAGLADPDESLAADPS